MKQIPVEDIETLAPLFTDSQFFTINSIKSTHYNVFITTKELEKIATIINEKVSFPFLFVIEEYQYPDKKEVYALMLTLSFRGMSPF